MHQGTTHQKIRSVSIWFYVIAAFELYAAYSFWSRAAGDASVAQAAMLLAGVDLAMGALFLVLGYFAAKKEPWAFIAGLVLYALRAVWQFFQFFSPIALIIRAFLLFRIFQGLQACLDAKQAEKLTRVQSMPRRLEMPQTPLAPPAQAWLPPRGMPASQSKGPLQS